MDEAVSKTPVFQDLEGSAPQKHGSDLAFLLEQATRQLMQSEKLRADALSQTAAHADPDVFQAATALKSSIADAQRDIDALARRAGALADEDSPWDEQSADALAEIYWGPAPRQPASETASANEPQGQSKGRRNPFDRLTQHFAELAASLDGKLTAAEARAELSALSERLGAIEAALGSARTNESIAQLHESLANLEADIRSLTATVDNVATSAVRLPDLERNLGALSQQIDQRLVAIARRPLQDEDIERLVQSLGGVVAGVIDKSRPVELSEATAGKLTQEIIAQVSREIPRPETVKHSDDDLKRVAESIARVLVQRVTATLQAQPRAEDAGLADIRKLLEASFQERREADEQVGGVLDTMQQALIGLLDRMDSVEAQGRELGRHLSREPSRNPQPGNAEFAAVADPLAQSQPKPQYPAERPAETAPASSGMPNLPPRLPEAPAAGAMTAGPPPMSAPPAPAAMTGSAPSHAAVNAAAPPTPKDDLIASARRAAAQAQAKSQSQAASAAAKPGAKKSAGKGTAKGGVNSRLFIALLVVVAAASAYLFVSRKSDALLPAVEKPSAPQKTGLVEEPAETEVADNTEATQKQEATSPGSVAQTTRVASPIDLIRQQEQAGYARLAAQLGGAVQPVAVKVAGEQPEIANPQRELPPAAVGPLSLRLAAQKGDPSAEFVVGSRLAEGRGVPQNIEEALRWYMRSAQQGFALAQFRLGTFYERGIGTAKDVQRAASWYKRAAEQGNVKAMHNLAAVLASRDSGVATDYETAAQWFTLAAEHGLRDSQFNLAILYENGLGVEKDASKAYRYLALAARGGDAQAVKKLQQARARLAPDEAQRIDDNLATWRVRFADRLANDPVAAGEDWKTRSASVADKNAAPEKSVD